MKVTVKMLWSVTENIVTRQISQLRSKLIKASLRVYNKCWDLTEPKIREFLWYAD